MNADQLLQSPIENPGPIRKTAKAPAGRSRMMAFVSDRQTEASLNACLSHLAFANVMVKRGGIARAIEVLCAGRSPENLIVDISGAEMPASKLHDLAEVCEPGVAVIAIGDRNDIGLYRDLKGAGVGEYIVKPVTVELLRKALTPTPSSVSRNPISRKLGKVISVVGARGGVGATTLAIHLAWHLANRQNRRVLLLDLDLQTGECALALNVTPTPGLCEALASPLRVDGVFIERTVALHGERLFVLSAEEPLREDLKFGADAIETLVGVLRSQFHYVIADVPRTLAAPYRRALDIADHRVIVADQTLRSVRDTLRLRDALGEGGATRSDLLVVNRCGEGGRRSMTLEDMAKVKLCPDFTIPFRPKLFAAPGVVQRGSITGVIAALAARISGRAAGRKRWWTFVRR